MRDNIKPFYVKKGKELLLTEDFTYKDIEILQGFTWDGASIPKPFRKHLGEKTNPHFITASLVHDYVYRTGIKPKSWADREFFKLLIQENVPIHKAIKMYLGVRWFGFVAWFIQKFKREKQAT